MANCDLINNMYDEAVERMAAAVAAHDAAFENWQKSIVVMVSADIAMVGCLAATAPPAIAICEVAAIAALAAAALSCDYYEDKTEAASERIEMIQHSLDVLSDLFQHCTEETTPGKDGKTDESKAEEHINTAEETFEEIPDSDDLEIDDELLDEAEEAVEEAEEDVEEAEQMASELENEYANS